MKILAIETSCDDTGLAILQAGQNRPPKILADLVSSQVKIHAPWGGVVPMLAKREHQKNILPIFISVLKESGLLKISKSKLKTEDSRLKILNSILEREPELLKKLLPFFKKYQKPDLDYIAVTQGPGLEPALWVGVNFARALAYGWDLPLIAVNHVEAHIIANWFALISASSNLETLNSKFLSPALCLVVSGGHTQLVLSRGLGNYEVIGETRDDAAGEAFDKVAKMLNLGYPGGPIIASIAAKFKVGNEKLKVRLPRPMINSDNFDFSFSGLKTATLYLIQKLRKNEVKKLIPAIAAEFQQAVVDVLVSKTIRAARQFKAKTIILAGGVASNDLLRKNLSNAARQLSINFSVPAKNLCTDNAAMVAMSAYLKIKNNPAGLKKNDWKNLSVQANLLIGSK